MKDIRELAERAIASAERGTLDGEERRIIESRSREPALARFALAVLDALDQMAVLRMQFSVNDIREEIRRNMEARK